MRRHHLHLLPMIFLLGWSLLITPVVTSSYVWCVSADGHGALEVAIAGDCAADAGAPATASLGVAPLTVGVDDCGPCLDISLTNQWGSSRSRQDDVPLKTPATVAPLAVAALRAFPPRLPGTQPPGNSPPRLSEALRHHRTIVLLV